MIYNHEYSNEWVAMEETPTKPKMKVNMQCYNTCEQQ